MSPEFNLGDSVNIQMDAGVEDWTDRELYMDLVESFDEIEWALYNELDHPPK